MKKLQKFLKINNNPESLTEQLFNLTNKKVVIIGDDDNHYGILHGPKIPTSTITVFLIVQNNDWNNAFLLKNVDIKRIDGRRIYLKSKPIINPKYYKNPNQEFANSGRRT